MAFSFSAILKHRLSIDNVFEFITILFVLALPYPPIYTNIVLMAISLVWIVEGKLKNKINRFSKNKLALLFTSLFIIFLLSLSYSENIKYGLRYMEKALPIFAFTVIFATSTYKVEQKRLNRLLNFFLLSCLIASLICLINAIYIQITTYGWGIEDIQWELFTYHTLTEILKISSVYFSIFISFAIAILLWKFPLLFKNHNIKGLIFYGLLFLFFLLILLLLSVRMQLLGTFLISVVSVLWYTIQKGKALIGIGIIVSMLILLFLMFKFNPLLNYKIKEAINYNNEYNIKKNWGGRALRLLKWDCSYEVIKRNPWMGVGIGDAQTALSNCYVEKNYKPLYLRKSLLFNSHNQYLQYGVSVGIVGLIIFLLVLLVPFYFSIKRKKYLYTLFLAVMMFSFITESVLQRQQGIIFYSFFNAVFAFNLFSEKKKEDMSDPSPHPLQ